MKHILYLLDKLIERIEDGRTCHKRLGMLFSFVLHYPSDEERRLDPDPELSFTLRSFRELDAIVVSSRA